MATTLAYEGDPDQLASPIPVLGLGSVQALALSGTAARTTNVVADGTTCVRIAWSVACHILIGPSTPTATTSHSLMPAAGWDHFKVEAGDRVSIVKADGASDGIATITESI